MSKLHYPLLPLAHFVSRLINGDPFSMSRWGDGEWNCVLGKQGQNCDRHQYFPKMGEELRDILRSKPPYALGLQPFAMQSDPGAEAIERWLADHSLDLPWINADVFHIANHRRALAPFVFALHRRPLVLVGPERLRHLYMYLKYAHFVSVPEKDCYLEKERILREVRRILDRLHDFPVVSFSASMATNVMIDELYRDYGDRVFLIDAGSLWDPYVGAVTRGQYHREIVEHCTQVSGYAASGQTAKPTRRPRRIVIPTKPTKPARYYPGPATGRPRRYP